MPQLGRDPCLHPSAEVTGSDFGRYVDIGEGARVSDSRIGDYSYCDRFAEIAHAEIGKFVSIASFARINPGNRPTSRASQHHFTYRASFYWPDAEDEAEVFAQRRETRCCIGHDSWIGHGAVILPGRSVGIGAVVGAGAVVSHDVPSYTVVGGVPAVQIRRRVPEKIAERLLALSWWDWDHARIRAALADFRALDAEGFLDKHGG